MTGPVERLAALRRWPASALGLRAAMLLAPPAALLTSTAAGDPAPPAVLAGVVLLSLGFCVAPESGFGLLALGSVAAWWCLVDDDGLQAWVLVAAVLLMIAHVAGLVAAYGPPGVPVDPAVGSVWLRRAALCLLVAPVVWVVAGLVRDTAPDAALWQAGLVAALLVVVLAGLALGAARSGERPTR